MGEPLPKHNVKRWEYVTREGTVLVCYAPTSNAAVELVERHLGRKPMGRVMHVPIERADVRITDERKAPGA